MLRAVGAWPVTRGLTLPAAREVPLPFAATIVFCAPVFFVGPLAAVAALIFAEGFLVAVDAVTGFAFAAADLFADEAVPVAVVDVSSATNIAPAQSSRPSSA